MVNPAEHGESHDFRACRELVPVRLLLGREAGGGIGEAGAEARVWSGAVVVLGPPQQEAPQVLLAEGQDVVEALTAQGADQTLAEGVLGEGFAAL